MKLNAICPNSVFNLRQQLFFVNSNQFTPIPQNKLVKTSQSSDIVTFCARSGSTIRAILNNSSSLEARVSSLKMFDCKNTRILNLLVSDKYALDYKEILDELLAKVTTYDDVSDMIPALEKIFDRRIFASSKKKLFDIFISSAPNNKKFLSELKKNSENSVTKFIYKEQFEKLADKLPDVDKKTAAQIKKILANYKKNDGGFSQDILDKIQVSRTLSGASIDTEQLMQNYMDAYKYVYSNMNKIPQIKDLKKIHYILSMNIPEHAQYKGMIKGTKEDTYQHVINPKTRESIAIKAVKIEDVPKQMKNFQFWYKNNYNSKDPFLFAAQVYKTLIKIHPFYETNGRTIRLFTEWLLGQKGYKINRYPDNFVLRKNTVEDIRKIIQENSAPINSTVQ